MPELFDPGYCAPEFIQLCQEYPDAGSQPDDPGRIYPASDFRTEWGPIFHRGRLDGTARVLVIGQDPADHEAFARRILVGDAGYRVQGFLARLGIVSSYVMINTFLYSLLIPASQAEQAHADNAPLIDYRHRWFSTLFDTQQIEAVVAFGTPARHTWERWKETEAGQGVSPAFAHVLHPSAHVPVAQLLGNWNEALQALHPVIQQDVEGELVPYGSDFEPGDLPTIPAADLPAGLPVWMQGPQPWATRPNDQPGVRALSLMATVPEASRPNDPARRPAVGCDPPA